MHVQEAEKQQGSEEDAQEVPSSGVEQGCGNISVSQCGEGGAHVDSSGETHLRRKEQKEKVGREVGEGGGRGEERTSRKDKEKNRIKDRSDRDRSAETVM